MKKWLKRITAAGLVVCLLLTLIPFMQKEKGSSTLEVSASDSMPMMRGVINSLHELPHYQNETNQAAARGTADHPFVVLELVPYEEYAEFGYKISGLEPVAVDEMYGRQELRTVGVTGDAEIAQNDMWHFFIEEPEAKDYKKMYDEAGEVPIESDSIWQESYYGYYEMVEEGTGTFRAQEIVVSAVSVARVGSGAGSDTGAESVGVPEAMSENGEEVAADGAEGPEGVENIGTAVPDQSGDSDTADIPENTEGLETIESLEDTEILDNTEILEGTEEIEVTESTEEPELRQLLFEREDGGNLIWHTVNEGQADYETAMQLAGDMNQTLENLGDRFYTTRTPSGDDPAIWVQFYFTYEHKESFLTDTLELSPEEAANYSIVIKTITPGELNNSPEWIDYADLICISQASHVNGLPALWQKYNRLHKEPSVDVDAISDYDFTKVDDISWDVTMRMFDKVTAEEDYAALVMDNGIYYKNNSMRKVTIDVLDWNFDSSGWTVSPEDAGNNNVYKLAVMLLCMDHSLFRSLYLSGENPVIQNGVNTLQQGDAATYWSPQTFLLVPPLTDRMPGYYDAFSYWGIRPEGDDPPLIWTNYKMVPILTTTDDWVSGHVYGYQTSSNFTMMYTSSQLNMIYKTEFDAAENSTPSDAVRYVLGMDSSREQVVWKDKLRILDIEPCVDLVWGQDVGNSNGNNGSSGNTTTVYFYNSDNFASVIAHAWKNDNENLTGGWGTTKAKISQTLGGNWMEVTVPATPGFHVIFANEAADSQRTTVDINDSKNVYVVMGNRTFESKAAAEASISNNARAGGSPNINRPNWVLTESYLRMLLPTFRGEIEIIHMTTAEFNGKVEDLNSTYDMIYLGLDFGAYNTRNMRGIKLDGAQQWRDIYLPDWNDNNMDGLIYFHNGDKLYAAGKTDMYAFNRSVNFLWDPKTGKTAVRSDGIWPVFSVAEMRFPGNDITSLKKQELEEFIAAGHPVVATRYLYNLEDSLIAGNTYIRAFVADKKGSGVYSTTQTADVTNAAARAREVVTFYTLPALYNGETNGNSSVITNPNYLPMSAGRSYLDFSFDVAEEGYNYSIYIDQNANSKFAQDEIVVSSQARLGTNNYTYRLGTTMVGLVQWRLEVYRRDNPQERYSVSGCSAARNNSGKKKQINVLQIMPDSTTHNGFLNLSDSALFKKYYQNLIDYDVTVTSVHWWQFNKWFEGSGFRYDFAEDISPTNPVNVDKISADSKLDTYNMIIVGFSDTYGATDIANNNGAVDYLKYWVAQGKGILFTHDLTSMANLPTGGNKTYGCTANTLLRDVMGMNRYQMVSNQLSDAEKQSTMKYQQKEGHYDTPYDAETAHGYTYYMMKRLAWISGGEQGPGERSWRNNHSRMCYRYMITNPEGNAVCNNNAFTANTGTNDNNDETTVATKINDGQITSYPYKIGDRLDVALTHGQYYELNLEDPDVTVWYCLGDDHYCTGWDDQETSYFGGGRGTALTYGVSPNDAANNYYIYSKENIFYSGVGHSLVNGDMEAKLFVNTMISAYSAAVEPPVIEISNPDAAVTGVQTYTLSVMQEFNNGTTVGNENTQVAEEFDENDFVTVTFTAVDFNTVTTQLEGCIRREDGVYIDQIVRLSDGMVITADADHKFKGLTNGTEYSMKYLKKDMENCRTIYFELKNNKVDSTNTTTLHMMIEPLFELD